MFVFDCVLFGIVYRCSSMYSTAVLQNSFVLSLMQSQFSIHRYKSDTSTKSLWFISIFFSCQCGFSIIIFFILKSLVVVVVSHNEEYNFSGNISINRMQSSWGLHQQTKLKYNFPGSSATNASEEFQILQFQFSPNRRAQYGCVNISIEIPQIANCEWIRVKLDERIAWRFGAFHLEACSILVWIVFGVTTWTKWNALQNLTSKMVLGELKELVENAENEWRVCIENRWCCEQEKHCMKHTKISHAAFSSTVFRC